MLICKHSPSLVFLLSGSRGDQGKCTWNPATSFITVSQGTVKTQPLMHTHAQTQRHSNMPRHIHIQVSIHTQMCMNIHIQTYTNTHTYEQRHIQTCPGTHRGIYTHSDKLAKTYMYRNTYTNTQTDTYSDMLEHTHGYLYTHIQT